MSKAAKDSGLSNKWNPVIFIIPALFDVLGTTTGLIGLYLTAASVYQMINSFNTVVTAIFSILFLKRTLYRHHYLAIILITTGVTLVAISSTNQASAIQPLLGIFFMLLSCIFSGLMYIVEE